MIKIEKKFTPKTFFYAENFFEFCTSIIEVPRNPSAVEPKSGVPKQKKRVEKVKKVEKNNEVEVKIEEVEFEEELAPELIAINITKGDDILSEEDFFGTSPCRNGTSIVFTLRYCDGKYYSFRRAIPKIQKTNFMVQNYMD